MKKTFGQVVYEAYWHHTDGKSLISGAAIPDWAHLQEPIRAAWEAAGSAVKLEGGEAVHG